MNKKYNLFKDAGPWADESIGKFTRGDVTKFANQEDSKIDVFIDASKIIATEHPKYKNQTWRQLALGGGKRSKEMEVYTQIMINGGRVWHDDEESRWQLLQIEDNYYVISGNHRSVAAKFASQECGVKVRCAMVVSIKENEDAKKAFFEISRVCKSYQRVDVKKLNEIKSEMSVSYNIYIELSGFGNLDNYFIAPNEAIRLVEEFNRSKLKKTFAYIRGKLISRKTTS